MNAMELLTGFKDIVLSGAAICGAILAFRGLSTWQRQLKGQSDYELARRILVDLFKYRDAISRVRHPAMFTDEMPAPPEEKAKDMSFTDLASYGVRNGYQRRWDKVVEQRAALYADLLEAQALWGDELNKLFEPIFELETELFLKLRNHLDLTDPKTNESKKRAIREVENGKRDSLFENFGAEPDDFKNDLTGAIAAVESFLKPKLRHD